MNNYQLYKTNVKLGGQLKWNICVSSMGSQMHINDFYLSPINDTIHFDKQENSLNYTHQENIVNLYNSNRSVFFDTKIDSEFITKYPIIINDDEQKDTYCSTYDTGIKRVSKKLCGESLSLFCPVWLEDFSYGDSLRFNIEAYIINNDERTIAVEKQIDILDNGDTSYHSRFAQYFNNYIKSIVNNGKIGDDLINIDFENKYAAVEGIDIRTGEIRIKNTKDQLANLLSRLRPMMDVDSILINMFGDNNMICKQLFNFNFLFDIEDIMPYYIREQIAGKELYFDISVNIVRQDGKVEKLEKKDFNYNYNESFETERKSKPNPALKYFEDYNCIDLLYKNKICPDIIHWSLTDNNDYIFNIYPNMYRETDLWTTTTKYNDNGTFWCNGEVNDEISENIEAEIKKIPYSKFTKFSPSSNIINNVKYKNINDTFYLYWVKSEKIQENAISIYKITGAENYYVIVVNNKDDITYAKFFEETITRIKDKTNNNFKENKLEQLGDIDAYPTILRVDNSIYKTFSKSPSDNSKELIYKKCTIPGLYLFRHFGKIKPTFIDFDKNDRYEIKKITIQEYNDFWNEFISTGYLPLYPSIKSSNNDEYFYLKKLDKNNKNENSVERKWFLDSNILVIESNFEISGEERVNINDNKIDAENIIKKELKTYYNINDNDQTIDYIYNLYNIKYNFDYTVVEDDKNKYFKYTYIIKLSLK